MSEETALLARLTWLALYPIREPIVINADDATLLLRKIGNLSARLATLEAERDKAEARANELADRYGRIFQEQRDRIANLTAEQAQQQKEHVHDYSDYQICRVCGRTEAAIDGQCHHCTDDDSIKNGRCWWCLRPLAATDAADAPIRESERVPHDQ